MGPILFLKSIYITIVRRKLSTTALAGERDFKKHEEDAEEHRASSQLSYSKWSIDQNMAANRKGLVFLTYTYESLKGLTLSHSYSESKQPVLTSH